jgi:general secretion pathway protein A
VYTAFYGLKEKPFALVPDPRFLYLGSSHREALAHLLYGIEEGEGFIEVVGQVGTGKTTLCRTLLDRVGRDVEIAFIFDPSHNEQELLRAVHREFGLDPGTRGNSELRAEFNDFLLRKKASGSRCILVIDEAQNLTPPVLEQIRLLSNLETQREKLIQIVLIGQPELEEMLARTDLRQLRQRITVRWDLKPFNRKESDEYIEHRLHIAGYRGEPLFSGAALRALFKYSGGIPRLINSLADRALLTGYTEGELEISAAMVRNAARELPATQHLGSFDWSKWTLGFAPRIALALLIGGIVLGLIGSALLPGGESQAKLPEKAPAVSTAPPVELPGAVKTPTQEAADLAATDALRPLLVGRSSGATAADALTVLLDLWGYDTPLESEIAPNQMVAVVQETSSLRVFPTRANLEQLRRLNLPVLLEVEPSPGKLRYIALLGMSSRGNTTLSAGDRLFVVSPDALNKFWAGRTFFLWTNYESLPVMTGGMSGSAVRWVQARLTDLGYLKPGDPSGQFDDSTAQAVRAFQARYALVETGEIGPETMIALYHALGYRAPKLAGNEGAS